MKADMQHLKRTRVARSQYFGELLDRIGADVRVRAIKGFYVGGGIGRTSVQASDSVLNDAGPAERGFRVTIPYASASVGYAGSYGMIELRKTFGLERIPIGGDVTGALELFTIHFGFNLVL